MTRAIATASAAKDRIRRALEGLTPEGQALKRHILKQLLHSTPGWLPAARIGDGGPKRTYASVRYALKALQRIGVVTETHPDAGKKDAIRVKLTPGTEDVVRAFLAHEPNDEKFPVSPLPALPRYQRLLKAFYAEPDRSFTVMSLHDKLVLGAAVTRRNLQELHESGYVTRTLPEPNTPGRKQFHYQLNPEATTYAFALINGTSW